MSAHFTAVVCLECGHAMPPDITTERCTQCQSPWVDARYDYEAVAGLWPAALQRRLHSLWRYGELLPLPPEREITMNEGHTPLIRLYQYERLYNVPHLYIKDERQGPTSSFKDRQAALAVSAMQQAGIRECVLASTGNAGAAYAAYCARAGIKLWLFLTDLVTPDKLREVALYGAEVIKVSGTYDEAKQVAAEFARRKGYHLDGGAKAIPGKESMKTLAYEIAEQLGLVMEQDRFVSPDWYIQAVSGGIGPLGVWKGFNELYHMGLIDRIPKLGIVQAAGCAPMVEAFHAGHELATPVTPKTLISVLATGDPGFSYVQLREAVLSNGGTMLSIDDGATFNALRRFAEIAGISVEPATAVAVAGLEKMLGDGIITPGEVVVMNCSGHTFPVESHILGDQYLLNLKLKQAHGTIDTTLKDDLSAALENLDEQITTILVVDDNLNDRRLIRRLLQRNRSYRVFEAQNGAEALKLVQERKPDLIVCDLTMPQMDGFTFVEKLQQNATTADIPVIVVSAKTLTLDDRRRLESTASIWTKGGFNTHQLVNHVIQALGHDPEAETLQRRTQPIPIFKSQNNLAEQRETSTDLPTVVIIDDDPTYLRLEKRYLKIGGQYNVIGANSGRDGLKAIYAYHPDLIILDLCLRDMSGFEVLDALSANPYFSDIPIIIVSSTEMSTAEIKNQNAQIQAVLYKEALSREAFSNAINAILAVE